MRHRILLVAAILATGAVAWRAAMAWQAESAAPQDPQQSTHNGVTVSSQAVGPQYRQDDWPTIAAAPDGSLWIAWLSFSGDHDDIALRHYQNGKWSNIH